MTEPRPPSPSASAGGAGPTRVLLVGGTSAGHLAPMVAIAEALKTIEPGVVLSFVCSEKPTDAAFLALERYSATPLPLPRANLALPVTFARALMRSFAILAREKPDVVCSKGSSVSVPLCLAAYLKNIPFVLHESDAVMGRANLFVTMFATKVCLGFEQADRDKRLATTRSIVTGNPVRSRIPQGNKEQGLRIAGFAGRKPVLLVMGGSQGALSINQAVARHLDSLLTTCNIIHLTGAGKSVSGNRAGYYATEFGSDVLPHLYAATNLAVSRAGAGSIAELAACGIPAILVPIRGLANDHQVKNAEAAEKTGAAILLPQEKLDDLPSLVEGILRDPAKSQTMRDACRYATRPEAARLIAETVLSSVAR